MKVQAGLD